jgi:hypothetical protein
VINPEATARQETLDRIQRWYEETQNPLYVWEAIARCLYADEQPAFPDWCLDYLRGAAANLYRLSCGLDFRMPSGTAAKNISPKDAINLVSEAFSLSKQGKNAFAKLRDNVDTMRIVNRCRDYGSWDKLVPEIEKQWNVTPKSARDRAARGKRLLRVKRKSSS